MVRVLARRVPFPQSDLDALDNLNDKNAYERDFNESIAYLTARDSNGNGHLVLCDSNGRIVTTGAATGIPMPSQLYGPNGQPIASSNPLYTSNTPLISVNVIPPRTDTATVTTGNIVVPSIANATLLFCVTAASGTTPSINFRPAMQDSQGNYVPLSNLVSTAITAANNAVILGLTLMGLLQSGQINMRIVATISGTTPSFTWYADSFYR